MGTRGTAPAPGKRARREALIDAVFRCVLRSGLDQATVDVIAAEAEVSRGVIHYHFRDKLELYEAAFERVTEGFQESLRRHPIDGSRPPVEQLRELVRLGLPLTRTSRERVKFWMQFMGRRTREKGLARINERHLQRWQGFLREELLAMQQRGAILDAADIDGLALAILAFSDGLGMYMATVAPDAQAIDEAVGSFVRGMACLAERGNEEECV